MERLGCYDFWVTVPFALHPSGHPSKKPFEDSFTPQTKPNTFRWQDETRGLARLKRLVASFKNCSHHITKMQKWLIQVVF